MLLKQLSAISLASFILAGTVASPHPPLKAQPPISFHRRMARR